MRLREAERVAYARDGYLLRRDLFQPDEVDRLRSAPEEVVASVVERARAGEGSREFRLAGDHRFQFARQSLIQWEWREGSGEVRLLEPVTHLDPRLDVLWSDPLLTEPMKDFLGVAGVCPFTSKLNLKRPREGSEYPWHQDYPYWYIRTPEHAHEIVNAMIFLDDAAADNGTLRILPGSHRTGPAPRDRSEPSQFLADPTQIDETKSVEVVAPAGSALFFPALLLHRSSPNTSERHRRALLLSYQPAGRERQETLPWHPELVHNLP
ncbi:MAG TPA: phytanoyl-CoA dioxygenase family protein [Myxococcota bacterium]|nr:phytanoyl-CoA dioxygenase family protein [Myxococcota bacterium]